MCELYVHIATCMLCSCNIYADCKSCGSITCIHDQTYACGGIILKNVYGFVRIDSASFWLCQHKLRAAFCGGATTPHKESLIVKCHWL